MSSRGKKKQIYLKEQQDARGISRKKWKHTMSFNTFLLIKIILIVLIPVVYFVCSPLLVVLMFAYIGVFFLAILTERGMNTSVIKSNHIHIPKFDSALALILVIVAFFGTIIGATQNTKQSQLTEVSEQYTITDFGSLLTGERNVFRLMFQFGTKNPPAQSNNPDVSYETGDPNDKVVGFNMKDLPIEYVMSSSKSTVTTVLVFSIAGVSALSLLYVYFRRKKHDKTMNEVIVDEEMLLTDETLNEILSFGEDIDENKSDG